MIHIFFYFTIWLKFHWNLLLKVQGPTHNTPSLVHVMAWHWIGAESSESMMTQFTDAYMYHQAQIYYDQYGILMHLIYFKIKVVNVSIISVVNIINFKQSLDDEMQIYSIEMITCSGICMKLNGLKNISTKNRSFVDTITQSGIILLMYSANERWCYIVTPSLIGWVHI